jgi:tRNA pseudouridine38-40 synthase
VSKLSQKNIRNIRLTIQYEGTNYNGWQRQKNTPLTIQEIIEKVLKNILREKVVLIAAGRTDAGVHAREQVANFKTANKMAVSKLRFALNSLLPEDIKVIHIQDAAPDFHSRYDSKYKTYRYTILNRSYPDIFQRRFVYFYPFPLDLKIMRKASRVLLGRHDFSSFKKTQKQDKSALRNLKAIDIKKQSDFIYIYITAEGFLYNMVRSIVGTLIEVGRRKLAVDSLRKILEAKNRKSAGPTAPACGLCLMEVKY